MMTVIPYQPNWTESYLQNGMNRSRALALSCTKIATEEEENPTKHYFEFRFRTKNRSENCVQ